MDAVAPEVATIVVVTRALAADPTKIVENKIEIVIVPMTTRRVDSMEIALIPVTVVVVR